MENNEAEYYTVMSLTTVYSYSYFRSKNIPLPVNSSKRIFGYKKYYIGFRLAVIHLKKNKTYYI